MEPKRELYQKKRELRAALSAMNGTPPIEAVKRYVENERAILFLSVRSIAQSEFPEWLGKLDTLDALYEAITNPRPEIDIKEK